jgi:ribonuclease P protein component
MNDYTFSKEERLCSKRLIDSLFHNGSSFVIYPYRVVFLSIAPEPTSRVPVQSIISVSKRKFRKAVDRNYIKRRVREAYRLQKSGLGRFLQEHSLHLLVAFQYVGKDRNIPYQQLHRGMAGALEKLMDETTKIYLGKDR